MNINIVNYCNLKCPYCFAVGLWKSSVDKIKAEEINIRNLKKVINFMKRSNISNFRMFGGEPTLHSRFEEVYDIISMNGFTVDMASNGVISRQRVDFLSKKKNLKNIAVNIQPPASYTVEQYEMINFTLTKLNKLINLGFVIDTLDFDGYFIIDLIKKYELRQSVKWSIAAPCFNQKNVSIKIEDHKKVIKRMVSHSRRFKRYNIHWYPDTTFMWCLFTKKQLDELYRNVRFIPENLCLPVLEVSPDLTVYRCYGTARLTNPELKIMDFKDEDDAYMYFFKKEMPFKTVGVFKKCYTCDSRGKMCGGGCLVHIIN